MQTILLGLVTVNEGARWSFEEETNRVDEIGPTSNNSFRRRQPVDQSSAVALGDDTRVCDHHDPAIGTASNESAEALLESERGVRKHVLIEGVSATCGDRFAMGR